MVGVFDGALVLVMVGVVAILGLGVVNMARGGTPQRSQQLMRWRVGLQALALVVVVAILWIGLYPKFFFALINPSVERLVSTLTAAAAAMR